MSELSTLCGRLLFKSLFVLTWDSCFPRNIFACWKTILWKVRFNNGLIRRTLSHCLFFDKRIFSMTSRIYYTRFPLIWWKIDFIFCPVIIRRLEGYLHFQVRLETLLISTVSANWIIQDTLIDHWRYLTFPYRKD